MAPLTPIASDINEYNMALEEYSGQMRRSIAPGSFVPSECLETPCGDRYCLVDEKNGMAHISSSGAPGVPATPSFQNRQGLSFVVADLDGDGNDDIFVKDGDGSVTRYGVFERIHGAPVLQSAGIGGESHRSGCRPAKQVERMNFQDFDALAVCLREERRRSGTDTPPSPGESGAFANFARSAFAHDTRMNIVRAAAVKRWTNLPPRLERTDVAAYYSAKPVRDNDPPNIVQMVFETRQISRTDGAVEPIYWDILHGGRFRIGAVATGRENSWFDRWVPDTAAYSYANFMNPGAPGDITDTIMRGAELFAVNLDFNPYFEKFARGNLFIWPRIHNSETGLRAGALFVLNTGFANDDARVSFRILVDEENAVSGKFPRIAYWALQDFHVERELDGTTYSGAYCVKEIIPWPIEFKADGSSVQTKDRYGWECSLSIWPCTNVNYSEQCGPQGDLYVVAVELPYPDSPTLDDINIMRRWSDRRTGVRLDNLTEIHN